MIRITLDLETVAEAQEVLAKLGASTVTHPRHDEQIVLPGAQPEKPAEKVRKSRSDAGQTRGPNARTTQAAATAAEMQTPPPAAPKQETAAGPTPTIEDCRAVMKRINGAKGLGMPGCMAHLAAFGIEKISDLPKEKYADFIAQANMKIAGTKA